MRNVAVGHLVGNGPARRSTLIAAPARGHRAGNPDVPCRAAGAQGAPHFGSLRLRRAGRAERHRALRGAAAPEARAGWADDQDGARPRLPDGGQVTVTRVPSLRRSLLVNLLVPTSALAIAFGLAGLLLINKTIESAYDRVLDGSARAIAERIAVEDGEISVDLPQVALGMLETRANDSVYYSVSYDRALITGYLDLPRADASAIPVGTVEHFDSLYKGVPVRVAAMTQAAYG